MKTRNVFKRKNLQTAILAALATGVVASSTVGAAGMPMVNPTIYALEGLTFPGEQIGLTVDKPQYWKMEIDRNPAAGQVEVTIFAPAGWMFRTVDLIADPLYNGPKIEIVNFTDDSAVAPDAVCTLTAGGGIGGGNPGEPTETNEAASFECESPTVGIDGFLNGGDDALKLMPGFVLDQKPGGTFCDPAAALNLAIRIIDESKGPSYVLDGTAFDGTDMGTIATTAAASKLQFVSKFQGLDGSGTDADLGFTTTNIFTSPPFAEFLPRPATFGPPNDEDADWTSGPFAGDRLYARSTFRLIPSAANFHMGMGDPAVDIDGSTVYVLGSLDEVMLNVNDVQQEMAGLRELCAGEDNACLGNPNEFVYPGAGPTATLTAPADAPFLLGANVVLQYNATGTENMGPQRVLMMDGKVTGEHGCVVPYAPEGMWEWGANGVVLEAHDIQKTTFDPVTGFTKRANTVQLTNNCKSEAPYTFYVGNGDAADNALSCGSLTPPAGLACTGVIPAASAGQPGNVQIFTNKLTKANHNTAMTARAYIATSPNCVHGSYDELDKDRGTATKTIMERDFFGRLDD